MSFLKTKLSYVCVCPGLMCIKEMSDTTLCTTDMPFSIPSASGDEVHLGTKHSRITPENRAEYIKLSMAHRLVVSLIL